MSNSRMLLVLSVETRKYASYSDSEMMTTRG